MVHLQFHFNSNLQQIYYHSRFSPLNFIRLFFFSFISLFIQTQVYKFYLYLYKAREIVCTNTNICRSVLYTYNYIDTNLFLPSSFHLSFFRSRFIQKQCTICICINRERTLIYQYKCFNLIQLYTNSNYMQIYTKKHIHNQTQFSYTRRSIYKRRLIYINHCDLYKLDALQ